MTVDPNDFIKNPDRKIMDKFIDCYKNLNEGEFNYEVLCGSIENKDMDVLIKRIENQIKFVQQYSDSKKRFDIMQKFFKKMEADKLIDFGVNNKQDNDFIDSKKVIQSSEIPFKNFKKYRNTKELDLAIETTCKMYANGYERCCRLFFKRFAERITQKTINSCGTCINEIIKYDPNTAFVLEPFNSQIRNSIDHGDYFYDKEHEVLVFDDREKRPIWISIEQLQIHCNFQIYSEVCIASAEFSLKMPLWKTVQYYFNKLEEYCKILQLDYKKTVLTWVNTGNNLL